MTKTVPGPEYEAEIMAAAAEDREPLDVAPPEDYQMSPAFSQWMVDRLRGEVLGQVSMAGLDRMAILSEKKPEQE
ncbi:MAG: hypothetical protein ACPHK8_06365 [Thermoplasmatota archaeon]